MDNLLEKAKEFLDKNFGYNEVELTDGTIKVRLVRYAPTIQYSYQPPSYSPNIY